MILLGTDNELLEVAYHPVGGIFEKFPNPIWDELMEPFTKLDQQRKDWIDGQE